MLTAQPSIAALRASFTWDIPDQFNIGVDICDKWALQDPDRLAIIDVAPDGQATQHSFDDLRRASNRLANGLTALGAGQGDRIGVLLPQCFETAVSHVTISKMGAIALPLFTLFGAEALLHRLRDSGARGIITNADGAAKLAGIRDHLPDLQIVLNVDDGSYHAACTGQDDAFVPLPTRAEDPAILIYTSGTTGNPKGALHAHRVLLGHLPGVEVSHDFLPHPDDRFWTPADWAWIGGLLDVLMPALHHGIAVVACRFEKFTAQAAFDLIAKYNIRNVFLPPTALKMMRLLPADQRPDVRLRSVASGGESLGTELVAWGRGALGCTINEFYGQTECNMVISCCAAIEAPALGSMGYPVPGHSVEVVDPVTGARMPQGEEGAIAVLSPDPVMFLEYWNNPEATREKFVTGPDGKWLLTGDRGRKDPQGRVFFVGRDDDVITSAGYRIGPAEVEDCLIAHPAVQMAGVVGMPDDLRGHVVAAYVTLADGYAPGAPLAEEIGQFVKSRLAAHEYPRVVRFIDQMPQTTTGKIIRGALRKLAGAEVAS